MVSVWRNSDFPIWPQNCNSWGTIKEREPRQLDLMQGLGSQLWGPGAAQA